MTNKRTIVELVKGVSLIVVGFIALEIVKFIIINLI